MQNEAAGLVRRIEDRLSEKPHDREMNEKLIGEIIKSEVVGKSNTWVIWLDHVEIVGSGGGRYVHFSYSWDETRKRYGYRIRDYEQDIMFRPPDTQAGDSGWNIRELLWTADEVWVAARRRIRTINETGLGEARLRSVDKNKGLWKEVLNVLSKNLPAIESHGQEA